MYFVEKTKSINFAKQFDYLLFTAVILLSTIGLFIVKSATLTNKDGGTRAFAIQLVGMGLGIICALILTAMDYKDFKSLGILMYIGTLGLMMLVPIIGVEVGGNKNWLRVGGITFQPSEFAKITFILMNALFLERIKEGEKVRKNLLQLLFFAALPIGLMVLQKDLGTTMVFVFIFFIMIFIAGIPYRYIFGAAGAFLATLPFIWFFVLNDTRKARILTFLNPDRDPLGAGFNVQRAKMAIGSGQITGKGLYRGIQNMNSVVPVKESDFIFSVVGEELGFVGCSIIVLLIFIILLRSISVARNAPDPFGSYIVSGVVALFSIHYLENVGMNIGLLPVTGIPLPFVSSGGTAVVAYFIAIGFVLSVSMRRKKVIFNAAP